MLSTRHTKLATLLLAAVMMTMLFVGVRTPVAHAQSLSGHPNHRLIAASAPPPCVAEPTHGIFCAAPRVNITCGGAIGQTNDFNGVPINWTFNTQSPGRVCVTVTYTFIHDTRPNCLLQFYVPNGDATAHVSFTAINTSNQVAAVQTFDENPVSGFQDLFNGQTIPQVNQITFTDVNDQPTNSRQIGWGRNTSYSLRAFCS